MSGFFAGRVRVAKVEYKPLRLHAIVHVEDLLQPILPGEAVVDRPDLLTDQQRIRDRFV